MQIVKAYGLRYQIEFVYRDGKQHCGWLHCPARSENKLDFYANAALTAINVAKFAHYKQKDKNKLQKDMIYSMADIKTLYFNEMMLNFFFQSFQINPNFKEKQQIINNCLRWGMKAA